MGQAREGQTLPLAIRPPESGGEASADDPDGVMSGHRTPCDRPRRIFGRRSRGSRRAAWHHAGMVFAAEEAIDGGFVLCPDMTPSGWLLASGPECRSRLFQEPLAKPRAHLVAPRGHGPIQARLGTDERRLKANGPPPERANPGKHETTPLPRPGIGSSPGGSGVAACHPTAGAGRQGSGRERNRRWTAMGRAWPSRRGSESLDAPAAFALAPKNSKRKLPGRSSRFLPPLPRVFPGKRLHSRAPLPSTHPTSRFSRSRL
jgi:hypothetical protein